MTLESHKFKQMSEDAYPFATFRIEEYVCLADSLTIPDI